MAASDTATIADGGRPSLAPRLSDWVLVAVLVPAVIAESMLRRDLVYPGVAAVAGTIIVVASLWRRRRPLHVLALTFAIIIGVDVVAMLRVGKPVVLYTGLVVVVILIHALFRWGSRNEILGGIALLVVAVVESQIVEFKGFANVLLGVFVVIATAELGWLVRAYYMGQEERRRVDRMLERERLARELHDTVAHRVSAITISAQAGKVRARNADPAVLGSFDEIEREATRAMAEMRLIVGRYRDDVDIPSATEGDGRDESALRIGDISQLASESTHPTVQVDVDVSGDVDDLDSAVESTAYRVAQESITNAFRHAHNATRVEVVVVGEADALRLTIRDDGDAVTATGPDDPSGYGLRGMTERAELVGGTLTAGPDPVKGWRVEAELPRARVPR